MEASEKESVPEVHDPERAKNLDSDIYRYIAPVVGPEDERTITDSGIEIDRLYEPSDVAPDL
ncbi:MAG: hypothetical protein ACR2K6_11685, partial [Solirubrobacterales bacterium]